MAKKELFIKLQPKITPVNGSIYTFTNLAPPAKPSPVAVSGTGTWTNGKYMINGVDKTDVVWIDAYVQWGVSLTDVSLSSLMTPAPNKEAVENKSRIQNGKRVLRNNTYIKKEERDINLEMHITARTKDSFWTYYDRFCDEVLDYGFLDVRTIYRTDRVFRLTYLSCQQFSEFIQQMAKYTLRVNEPDPTNRGVTAIW